MEQKTIFQRVGKIRDAIARGAASAGELLADRELRKKASQLVARTAGERMKDIQTGVQSGAGQLGRGLAQGPRQIQAILARLQARMEEQRLQASLQAERDAPVDVQVGPLLCEDAPQELRSRMWMALLADPTLCGNLLEEKAVEEERGMGGCGSARTPRSTSFTSSRTAAVSPRGSGSVAAAAAGALAAAGPPHSTAPGAHARAPEQTHRAGAAAEHFPPVADTDKPSHGDGDEASEPAAYQQERGPEKGSSGHGGGKGFEELGARGMRRRFGAGRERWGGGGSGTAASSEAGSVDGASLATERGSEAGLGDIGEEPVLERSDDAPEPAPDAVCPAAAAAKAPTAEDGEQGAAPGDLQPGQISSGSAVAGAHAQPGNEHPATKASPLLHPLDPAAAQAGEGGRTLLPGSEQGQPAGHPCREKESAPHTEHQQQQQQALPPSDVGHLPVARTPSGRRGSHSSSDPGHMSADRSQDGEAGSEEAGLEQWEMVVGASRLYDWHGSRLAAAPGAAALHLPRTASAGSQPPDTLRSRIMAAVWNVLWPISTEYSEDSRYNTYLQVTLGQEEVDEVITRDIHRTFPEHPQFGFAQGQQALFRVLKAYSLHDLEVSYCQGMAFVAGVVLMYLPEEPAFGVLTRLMGPGGPDLRALFLPGLEGLKQLLRCFEWLMTRLIPRVQAHLLEYTALPVLYASQWFLTCFSNPFPSSFACRVIDVLLQEQRAHVLLRLALAIVAECEAELLELDDFEDIITYLKVEPVRWPHARMRKVLNAAIVSGFVGDDMITAAEQALSDGFQGSLSRRVSAAPDPEAAAAAVTAARERQAELAARVGAMTPPAESPRSRDSADELLEAAGPRGPGYEAGSSTAAADKATVLLDPDVMAMALAMDTLWAGDGSEEAMRGGGDGH